MTHEAIVSKIEIAGFKNCPTIYFDSNLIQNYADAPDNEKKAFLHILEYPQFCGKEGDSGIKQITQNPPKCTLNFIDNNTAKNIRIEAPIKYEMKLKGTSKEGRIGLCEIKTDSKTDPIVLIAIHYAENGFHSAKSVNKKYNANLKHFGLFANPITSNHTREKKTKNTVTPGR